MKLFSLKNQAQITYRIPHQFNNNDISICTIKKNLGILLDSKLEFNAHVDENILKVQQNHKHY